MGAYTTSMLTLPGTPTRSDPFGVGSAIALLLTILLVMSVVIISVGFVLHSTRRYENVPAGGGLALAGQAVGVAIVPVVSNRLFVIPNQLGATTVAGGLALTATGCLLAVSRYDCFEYRLSAGTIGEETAIAEMEDGIVVLDEQEQIVTANAAARRVLDVPADGMGGQTVEDVLGMDVGTLDRTQTVEFETDEGSRRFAPRVSEITDDSGHEVGTVVNLPDITERTIREQRVQVLNRVLRHNLRNDLGVVRSHAELLQDGDVTVEESTEAILTHANDLLELGERAREIEAIVAADEVEPTSHSLSEQVERLLDALREQYPQTTFETDLAVDRVTVDEDTLWYVLENLVENAARHNDAFQPRVRILSRVEDAGGLPVRIEVHDNGPGIPANERHVIDEEEESTLEHGSGLGLWASKWGVRRLGGELQFGHSPLGGAAVTVALPTDVYTSDE